MTRRVVGLDLSLTSSGWAVSLLSDAPRTHPNALTGRIEPGDKRRSHTRMEYILWEIAQLTERATLVMIEEPVAHAPGRGDSRIEQHGLSWLVRHQLWGSGKPYVMVAPAALKFYATGKGVGDKFVVVQAAMRRFPEVLFNGPDEADALWLAAMGADHLGSPLADMPAANRRALGKVLWPEVPRA